MAVPKRRKSKSRRDMRRASKKSTVPNLTSCPQCGEAKLPHMACMECGTYKGRNVLQNEES